jgi:aminopeptidase N
MKSGLQQIILHINDLEISTYSLARVNVAGGPTNIGGGDYKAEQYDEVTDKWTINLTQPLTSAQHILTVYYRGFLRDDMQGFYRSYYMEKGNKVWMASTQLQQTEARRAFPCFDVKKIFIAI